jgi:hypothetical protein
LRIFAKLVFSAVVALVLFVIGVMATFAVNTVIYGFEEFDGNAGANFGVLMEGILAGIVLAVFGAALALYLFFRNPNRPASEPPAPTGT